VIANFLQIEADLVCLWEQHNSQNTRSVCKKSVILKYEVCLWKQGISQGMRCACETRVWRTERWQFSNV
jgi:hypothetical protein